MKASKNVAFDFDGTLVTCKPRQVTALRVVVDLSSEELERYWSLKRDGKNNTEALTSLGISFSKAEIISSNWKKIIESPSLLSLDTLFEGTIGMLKSLIENGYELHLVTARQHECFLVTQLKNLNIHSLFRSIAVVNPRCPVEGKARVLRYLNPVVFIGDSEVDLFAAKVACKSFKAVATGQRSVAFLKTHGITPHCDLTEAIQSTFIKRHQA